MDKATIIKNFSRSARFYDKYADIQKTSARELSHYFTHNGARKIMEIGCGTGNYTLLLRDRFKRARLSCMDISAEMIAVAKSKFPAKGIEFRVGDGEYIDEGRFDLITSNACLQWFEDLEQALIRYKGLLNKGGNISFSIFGPRTFQELRYILKSYFNAAGVAADNFIDLGRVKDIFCRNFAKARIREKIYLEHLPHLKDLLKKIKYTGVRGDGLGGKLAFTGRHLKNLEQLYLAKFGGIKVTYQVFFCQGRK